MYLSSIQAVLVDLEKTGQYKEMLPLEKEMDEAQDCIPVHSPVDVSVAIRPVYLEVIFNLKELAALGVGDYKTANALATKSPFAHKGIVDHTRVLIALNRQSEIKEKVETLCKALQTDHESKLDSSFSGDSNEFYAFSELIDLIHALISFDQLDLAECVENAELKILHLLDLDAKEAPAEQTLSRNARNAKTRLALCQSELALARHNNTLAKVKAKEAYSYWLSMDMENATKGNKLGFLPTDELFKILIECNMEQELSEVLKKVNANFARYYPGYIAWGPWRDSSAISLIERRTDKISQALSRKFEALDPP
jgi:hypothetical protein